MGLDQYLTARRGFTPDAADHILTAANISLEALQQMSRNDPSEEETYVYLSRWGFLGENDEGRAEIARATAVEEAAGLLAFATPRSEGGSLRWDADRGLVTVSITCIYWRKSNQIHRWFVQNCQNGVDDCGEYDVHPEQLAQLRSECIQALDAYNANNPEQAKQILPPQQGFFFGGYEIDEWYANDLKETIAEIERVTTLATELRGGGVEFAYESSW